MQLHGPIIFERVEDSRLEILELAFVRLFSEKIVSCWHVADRSTPDHAAAEATAAVVSFSDWDHARLTFPMYFAIIDR